MSKVTKLATTGLPSAESDVALVVLSALKSELIIPLDGLVNREEELKRLTKDLQKTKEDLEFVTNKLSRPDFIAKAPEALVTKEKAKQADFEKRVVELTAALQKLQKKK